MNHNATSLIDFPDLLVVTTTTAAPLDDKLLINGNSKGRKKILEAKFAQM